MAGSDSTGGTIHVNTLLVSEGAEILADSVIFEEGGYLGGEGSFTFDVTNSGGINPGDSLGTPGLFSIDGKYTQLSSGTLFIELGGDDPGSEFDQLVVSGEATLSGTLDVTALNEFEPNVGQTFEIFKADNIAGTFDEVVTHDSLGVVVTYNVDNLLLTVTSPRVVGVGDPESINVLVRELEQNFPNPFSERTTVRFAITEPGDASLEVFDVMGRQVGAIQNRTLPAGTHTFEFDGSMLASGVYFYRLMAGGYNSVRQMIVRR